jgi:hypothetical protein
MKPRVLRVLRGVVVISCTILVSSCGYSLSGRGSFLPDHIHAIGVPLFTNSTPIFEVERKLTERVRTELLGRGKYKVVPEATGVDAVLSGVITSIAIAPAGFTAEQQASRYAITMTARIELKDLKTDKVLVSNPSLQFREEYEITTGTSGVDPAAFFGQESQAVDRIASDFAKAVVTAILEAF